jgi:hypothetical protein
MLIKRHSELTLLSDPFMADAGQIGREEAFPAQQLANGFIAGLGLQVDLEFLLGAEEAALLVRARFWYVVWMVVGHVFGGGCDRLRQGDGSGRPPSSFHHPPACHLVAYCQPTVRSQTQKRRASGAIAGHYPVGVEPHVPTGNSEGPRNSFPD